MQQKKAASSMLAAIRPSLETRGTILYLNKKMPAQEKSNTILEIKKEGHVCRLHPLTPRSRSKSSAIPFHGYPSPPLLV